MLEKVCVNHRPFLAFIILWTILLHSKRHAQYPKIYQLKFLLELDIFVTKDTIMRVLS